MGDSDTRNMYSNRQIKSTLYHVHLVGTSVLEYLLLVRKTQSSWLGNDNADKISNLFGVTESATCCIPVQNLPHFEEGCTVFRKALKEQRNTTRVC